MWKYFIKKTELSPFPGLLAYLLPIHNALCCHVWIKRIDSISCKWWCISLWMRFLFTLEKKKKYLLIDGSIFHSSVHTTPAVPQAFSHYSLRLQRSRDMELMAKSFRWNRVAPPALIIHAYVIDWVPDFPLSSSYRLSTHSFLPAWLQKQFRAQSQTKQGNKKPEPNAAANRCIWGDNSLVH